jgi:hypothetical protein
MEIILTDRAHLDLHYFKKTNNQIVLKKIRQLFESMLLIHHLALENQKN